LLIRGSFIPGLLLPGLLIRRSSKCFRNAGGAQRW